MRNLNRVIFINSAHIPYAEVKLDGNVHFIGTQGVGKSTVLRAILFFYNADKQKLGIPKEKSSFDSYYFSYTNSYIVYEVVREGGAYCVVASKSQGRAAFHFIDAPYQREWFIDDVNSVYSDWSKIREQVGRGIFISKRIERYEEYRDIIFGNNRRSELTAFRRFAIAESPNYKNIPRTIQNVFLNAKLDADFIKDTIIKSMNDDELAIDLDFYRNQIKRFEQEYTDVSLWFEKKKKGERTLLMQSQRVIDLYRNLLYTAKQIQENRAMLNYAGRVAAESIPQLTMALEKIRTEQDKKKQERNSLEQKYNTERDKLNKTKGALQNFLQILRVKQKDYEQKNINEIITRVVQEPYCEEQKKQLEESKRLITSAFVDIETKYKALTNEAKSAYDTHSLSLRQRELDEKQKVSDKTQEIKDQQRTQTTAIQTGYDERCKEYDAQIHELELTQAKENSALERLKLENPFKEERERCADEEQAFQLLLGKLKSDITHLKAEVDRIITATSNDIQRLEWKRDSTIKEVHVRKDVLSAQLEDVERLIVQRSGSFCEWLDEHKPQWKETIGCIAHEERILYNSDLSPTLAGNDDTLFGVKLNLSEVIVNIRTPDDLIKEKKQFQEAIEKCKTELTELEKQHAESVEQIRKKNTPQVRAIKNSIHEKEAESGQIPNKMKQLQAELATINAKESKWREERQQEITDRQNKLAHHKIQLEETKQSIIAERDRKLRTCESSFKSQIQSLDKEFKEFALRIDEELNIAKQKFNIDKADLDALRQQELAGKGADIATIQRYDSEIKVLEQELRYIKQHQAIVHEYNMDKREYFDQEIDKREEEKRVNNKLNELQEKYNAKRARLTSEYSECETQKRDLESKQHQLIEGLDAKQKFLDDQTVSPIGLEVLHEQETTRSCKEIVEELRNMIYGRNTKVDGFKKSVNEFKGNFSPMNTFHFKLDLLIEDDYFDFASNLCEFIDNNKIEEYKKRISEHYIDILRRISTEVSNLTRNESEVKKTIHEINNDFHKRNFAGVIKEIALQADVSNDKIVQLLMAIKRFNDDYQYEMGAADLFSQDDSSRNEVNEQVVKYLFAFMRNLNDEPSRKGVSISDTFQLKFRIKENDNDTGWVEKIANVGSEGTDILVKAMVNIMLINVFKEKASRKFGDFKIHCMMDEMGKLHPENVKGILDFASSRNILLINSSPTTFNAADYKYTYLLSKDGESNTKVVSILANR